MKSSDVFFFVPIKGLFILRSTASCQQGHPAALHGQPFPVHSPPQGRHHRGPADEGSGHTREAAEEDGEVGGPAEAEPGKWAINMSSECECGLQRSARQ